MYDPSLKGVTQLCTPHIEETEAIVAATFWNNPSSKLHMVGVTGTSGKTTTTYLVRHLYSHFGVSSGLMGTVTYIAGNHQRSAIRTTPDVITTHSFLNEVVQSGATACVMEVSSHALMQGRTAQVDFDTAVFTNLTPEHLDYHGTREAYADAKSLLFMKLLKKPDPLAIFNAQDPWAQAVVGNCPAKKLSFALEAPADVTAKNIILSRENTRFDICFAGETVSVCWPLAGKFNVANALAATCVFLGRGYRLQEIAQGITSFSAPPGRLERVPNEKGLTIFVDYAHKEDALFKVLKTLRETTSGKLITVFGCGGDRDKQKRPKMAKAAEQFSDLTIVTSDNPRSEDPMTIIQQICTGFTSSLYQVIPDRKSAIQYAIQQATPSDIILIAGKGHEHYQIFSQGTIPFDDCEIARECCKGGQ
jgi:UDP-N-acetylmuramoyl-L-alanyl-D-glutamate--2,6-diaminopimelate ligase